LSAQKDETELSQEMIARLVDGVTAELLEHFSDARVSQALQKAPALRKRKR
jgi:hypothetical protein